MKVVIIGGGSAGTTVAFELRKIDKDIEITILEKTFNTEYSPCSLPYLISGEIESSDSIFVYKKEDYIQNNINLINGVEVIDIEEKKVKTSTGENFEYDYLVLATGSAAKVSNCSTLKTLDDAARIKGNMPNYENVAIVGAGMIGLELANSLFLKGKKVTLLERESSLLPGLLDEDMSRIIEEEINFEFRAKINIIDISDFKIKTENEEIVFDKVFSCLGFVPNLELAKKAKISLNKGIIVDEFMKTSSKNIYACGDCVETVNLVTGEKTLSMMGNVAVKQGRIVAQNILENSEEFRGVLNNTITKIGSKYIGAVGINLKYAYGNNIKVLFSKYSTSVRSSYFSDEKITVKLIFDSSGIIVGGQIIGDNEVVGRLNLLSMAISKKMTLNDLVDLETAYNPASAAIFDPIVVAAQVGLKKLKFLK